MKSNFKQFLICLTCFFTISGNSEARDVVLISTTSNYLKKRKLIEKIIAEKLNIPQKLITTETSKSPCGPRRDTVIHICINKKGKMIIPHTNNNVLRNSFKVFRTNSI